MKTPCWTVEPWEDPVDSEGIAIVLKIADPSALVGSLRALDLKAFIAARELREDDYAYVRIVARYPRRAVDNEVAMAESLIGLPGADLAVAHLLSLVVKDADRARDGELALYRDESSPIGLELAATLIARHDKKGTSPDPELVVAFMRFFRRCDWGHIADQEEKLPIRALLRAKVPAAEQRAFVKSVVRDHEVFECFEAQLEIITKEFPKVLGGS